MLDKQPVFDDQLSRSSLTEVERSERKEFYRRHIQLLSDIRATKARLNCGLLISYIDETLYRTLCYDALDEHPRYRPFSARNYAETFELLREADYAFAELQLRRYDRERVWVERVVDGDGYCNQYAKPDVYKSGLKSGVHHLLLISLEDHKRHVGRINEVSDEFVRFKTTDQWYSEYPDYCDDITVGFYSIRLLGHAGLLISEKHELWTFSENRLRFHSFFDEPGFKLQYRSIKNCNESFLVKRMLQAGNKQVQLSSSQLDAIRHICEAQHRPGPYILLGGPGTGKTTTIVALVAQLYCSRRNARILVTSNSNPSVDILANEIHSTGQVKSMCRLVSRWSPSHTERSYYFTTNYHDSRNYRVLVTTRGMCRRHMQSYDVVIADEACFTAEPLVLTIINRCEKEGIIVLAGDPNQIPQVCEYQQAERLGLGQSIVERLINQVDRYKRKNAAFDARYVTELTENFRCDKRILQLSNELFYESRIECERAQTPPSLLKMLELRCRDEQSRIFHPKAPPEEQFRLNKPILFIGVAENSTEDEARLSSKYDPNATEVCVDMIMELYKMGLEAHQIGVIAQYKSIKDKLNGALRARLDRELCMLNERFADACESSFSDWLCMIDITVGFEGCEREVIIIPMVKAPFDLEFVDQNYLSYNKLTGRFNARIGRAKWLCVVIGHESVLRGAPVWSRYLDRAVHFEA